MTTWPDGRGGVPEIRCDLCKRDFDWRTDGGFYINAEGYEVEGVNFGMNGVDSECVCGLDFCSRKCLHNWIDSMLDKLEKKMETSR